MIPIQQMHQHHQQQQQQLHSQTMPTTTQQPLAKREKMVTFEDETKCPHGVPTTPRKSMQMNSVGDVFM